MTGMKRLPSNARHTTWDSGLSTVPLKHVPIGPQDPFRGHNLAVSGPSTCEYVKSRPWFAKTGVYFYLNGPAIELSKGQMGNLSVWKTSPFCIDVTTGLGERVPQHGRSYP